MNIKKSPEYSGDFLFCDIVYRHIVSLLSWNHDDIESNPREVWLYDTAIVSVVCLPFFTHEKVKSSTNRPDHHISTITRTTGIVSVSDILRMFGSVHYLGIDSTGDEPLIYESEVVVSVSWVAGMMIGSSSL